MPGMPYGIPPRPEGMVLEVSEELGSVVLRQNQQGIIVGDTTARSILGALIMSPALLTASDDLCADLFGGRDRLVFSAIDKIWDESQPAQIEIAILADRLGDKVSPAYLASLLDGVVSVQPDGFVSLANELARRKIARAIVKTVSDAGEELVKTGDVDLAVLKPLIDKYSTIGEKEKRASSDIREWAMASCGEFTTQRVYNDLGMRTKQEKGLVRAVIFKLVKEGVLTPVGKHDGVYRKVEKTLEEVDLLGVAPNPLDLYLPLGIDHLVKIYPRSIIVIAGAANYGKTALAYDFIKHNMDKHEVSLFFSEGGAESLRDRLERHSDRTIGQWRFKAYPRTQNFEDVIDPNGVNVIDYLLLGDEFWLIARYLDAIYRKLDKGIAYVCLQKDKKAEIGRGGEFGLERPQLYVTLNPDLEVESPEDGHQYCLAKIIKAKAWKRKGVNPDGKMVKFSIEDGWAIECWHDWHFQQKKEKKADTTFHARRT